MLHIYIYIYIFIHGSPGNWLRIPWDPRSTLWGTTALAHQTKCLAVRGLQERKCSSEVKSLNFRSLGKRPWRLTNSKPPPPWLWGSQAQNSVLRYNKHYVWRSQTVGKWSRVDQSVGINVLFVFVLLSANNTQVKRNSSPRPTTRDMALPRGSATGLLNYHLKLCASLWLVSLQQAISTFHKTET